VCCIYKGENVISMLLDNGADVNAKDAFSFTPLQYAAHTGNVEALRILLNCSKDNLEVIKTFTFTSSSCDIILCIIPVGKIAKKNKLKSAVLLFRHSNYSAIMSKIHSYRLRLCPLGCVLFLVYSIPSSAENFS